jgi:hypothetical protein
MQLQPYNKTQDGNKTWELMMQKTEYCPLNDAEHYGARTRFYGDVRQQSELTNAGSKMISSNLL